MRMRIFAHSVVIGALLTGLMEASAIADEGRKVTRYNYDGIGRQIETKSYDDVGASAQLLTHTETTYDQIDNVIRTVQHGVAIDQDGDGNTELARYDDLVMPPKSYSRTIQVIGYEDSEWPTKVTHKYQPRFYDDNGTLDFTDDDPDISTAAQFWYDQTTGNVELYLSSPELCIETSSSPSIPPISTGSLAHTSPVDQTSTSLSLERSGSPVPAINIKAEATCHAQARFYDNKHRIIEIKDSLALHHQQYAYTSPPFLPYLDNVWKETVLEYYNDQTNAEKGALKSVWVGSPDEPLHMRMDVDWDAIGNLTSITQITDFTANTGNTVTASYDTLRRVIESHDAENGITKYLYDLTGRKRDVLKLLPKNDPADPDSWSQTHADYYANGQLYKLIDPDGDTLTYTYDLAGRLDTTTDGAGRVSKNIYYSNGSIKCSVQGYGTPLAQAYTMFDYTADGQIYRRRPAKGVTLIGGTTPTDCNATNDTYDTVYFYDEFRRPFETIFPKRPEDAGMTNPRTGNGYAKTAGTFSGHTSSRQWVDESGLPIQSLTRYGDLHTFSHNVTGHLTWTITPEAHKYQSTLGSGYMYYADIRPSIQNGVGVAPTYSDNNRRYVSLSFDSLGRPSHEKAHEKSNGVWAASHLQPGSTRYFDAAGNLNHLYFHGGSLANFYYDKRGAMKTAYFYSGGNNSISKKVAHFYYDTIGRKTHHYLSNSSAPTYGLQYWRYDADSDLKQAWHYWQDTPPDVNTPSEGLRYFGHYYDQDGSGKITDVFAQDPFDYDTGTNISTSEGTWRMNPKHQASLTYASANGLDQYSQVSGNLHMESLMQDGSAPSTTTMNVTYDGNGSVTNDGEGRSFSYNSENQLVRVTGTGLDMEYWYDALGRRSHSVDHTAGTETFHGHVGQMEVGDYAVTRDATTNVVTTYDAIFRIIPGQGIDQRLAIQDVATDNLNFPLVNHQGSTIAMINELGQRLTDASGGKFIYGPYGEELTDASLTGYPFRFTGRRLDAQTGCYYYRARYMCPGPNGARFLQTDPIGYDDQANLYTYVGNDPVNVTDPSGMEMECNQSTNSCTHVETGTTRTFTKEVPGSAWQRLQESVAPSDIASAVDTALENASLTQRVTGRTGDELPDQERFSLTTKGPVDLKHVVGSLAIQSKGNEVGFLKEIKDKMGFIPILTSGYEAEASAFKTEDVLSNAIGESAYNYKMSLSPELYNATSWGDAVVHAMTNIHGAAPISEDVVLFMDYYIYAPVERSFFVPSK